MKAIGPNAQQIEFWNTTGKRWVQVQADIDAQLEPLGLAAIERAALRPGETALDVGCGCGQATLQLAERVGPQGRVRGIDISEPMLARARERAGEAKLENVELSSGDAQTEAFPEGGFDLIFSRYGVMFFADSAAAFSNLRRALAKSGRLVFVCWQELGKNPWMQVPMGAALAHLPQPEPATPGAPGPFALGDAERVRAILAAAGFAEVTVEALERPILLGGGGKLEDAVRFVLEVGPTSRLLRDADEAVRERVRKSVTDVLAAHASAEGVRLGSASWIVSARG
ncbi:MAG: methyltransferase domain-containing protein [Myxococcota bacterium]